MKKIITFLIILVVFLYFNNSKEVKKEGFYSISFFILTIKKRFLKLKILKLIILKILYNLWFQ